MADMKSRSTFCAKCDAEIKAGDFVGVSKNTDLAGSICRQCYFSENELPTTHPRFKGEKGLLQTLEDNGEIITKLKWQR